MKKTIEVERKFIISKDWEGKLTSSFTRGEILSNSNSLPQQQQQPQEQLKTTTHEFDIENKLIVLGFIQQKGSTFEDTYFDLPSPYWFLSTNDQWLRYRQYFLSEDEEKEKDQHRPQKRGAWQLKRSFRMMLHKTSPRQTEKQQQQQPSSSIYEELDNEDALNEVLFLWREHRKILSKEEQKNLLIHIKNKEKNDMLIKMKNKPPPIRENIPIFHEPWNELNQVLQPFAQFKTFRSTWILNTTFVDRTYENLIIDLDVTDFGYTIGEAEIMVQSYQEIPLAQTTISKFLETLLEEENNKKSNIGLEEKIHAGKLQVYLQEKDIQHYQACIQAGTLL